MIEEGKSAKDAALITGINIRTAQHYIKKYKDDEEKMLAYQMQQASSGTER